MNQPNNVIRNLCLVLLTMTSGCVDAISFISLGQVFTAAMTGNTVLFGLAAVHLDGLRVGGYAVALFGFILGVAIGAVLLRRKPHVSGWNKAVTVTLTLELCALLLFAILTTWSNLPDSDLRMDLFIFVLACAMGLQGVAARRIGVGGVTTTVITSTLTGLVESVVWRIGAAAGKGDETTTAKTGIAPLKSVSIWITVIVSYGVGAAMCGALQRVWAFQAIWLPVAFVSFVVVSAVVSGLIPVQVGKGTQTNM